MNKLFAKLTGSPDIDPEFKRWVENNYGPVNHISKSDLDGLYADWQKRQATPNALMGN